MKIEKLLLAALFILGVAFLYLVKNSGPKKNKDVIIVGTSADYPPYEFKDFKTDEVVGFDIDIVNEIGRRLGKKVEIKDIPFTSLVFDLFTRNIDILVAGMTPTERKAKAVNFSKKYLEGDPLVMLSRSSAGEFSEKDLYGKRIVVNTGYSAENYLSEIEGLDLIRVKSPADAFMILNSGAADIFVAAKSSLTTFLENKERAKQFKISTLPVEDSCAIAINKSDEKLLNLVNKAIDQMKNDGTIEKLKEKWKLT